MITIKGKRAALVPCTGRLENSHSKRVVFCRTCGYVDYELNEGDKCQGYMIVPATRAVRS